MYWDDENLTVEEYDLKQKHYYCGRELLKFPDVKEVMYRILVLDMDECCYATVYSDGEIEPGFQEHSSVPHKHRKGGQSAARFSRIRDNEITHWYKRIDEYLKTVDGDISLGINSVYKNRFLKTLSTYNKQKIKEVQSIEYANITGIYQYINKKEYEKNGIRTI